MSLQDLSYFFVPFASLFGKDANLTDPVLIVISVFWTSIIILTGIKFPESLPIDDINILSSVLGGTLGFLLPLYLSTCIEKNRSGITLYDAYCGDVVALAWEVAAYGDGVEALKGNSKQVSKQLADDLTQKDDTEAWKTLRKEIFQIMIEMPMIIKHVFRNDFRYDKVDDEQLSSWMQKIDKGKEHPIEEIMFLLVMRLRRMPTVTSDKTTSGDILQIMMKKWNDIYSSYGTTASLIQYQEPLLFSYILYTAMGIYILLLPFTFSDTESFNNIWLSGLIVYFFLSLNAAGRLLQNPFTKINENSNIFATVTQTSRDTVSIIKKIRDYGKDPRSLRRQNATRTLNFSRNKTFKRTNY